jgi:hypothetical protein
MDVARLLAARFPYGDFRPALSVSRAVSENAVNRQR